MAWEEGLFAFLDELEQQADALYAADRLPELADRSRAAYAEVTLASRLMASVDEPLGLEVVGPGRVDGVLERVSAGWCALRSTDQDWVVALAAVQAVHGASPRSVPEAAWSPITRLGLGSPLRRLADTGSRCVVHLRDGSRHEGVPRRVGADFLELAVGERGERLVIVAFQALAAVQSRD